MMYWILLVTLSLSVFVLLHSVAVLLASAALRISSHRLERMGPKRAVNVLLGLRGFPLTASGLIVLGIVVPAFLRHEPVGGEEHLSFKLIVLTAIAGALVVHSIGRSLHLLLRTRRLTREWQRSAERLAVPEAPLPVYRFVHEHPQMAVIGLLRPRLFVSSGALALLDADELDAALAHETAHYHAADLWKQLAMRGLPDLLPGTRSLALADRLFLRKVEEAADENGTRDRRKAVPLASALMKFARGHGARNSAPAILGAHLVERVQEPELAVRVAQLLAEKPPQPANLRFARLTVLCAVLPGIALSDYDAILQQTHALLEILAR